MHPDKLDMHTPAALWRIYRRKWRPWFAALAVVGLMLTVYPIVYIGRVVAHAARNPEE